MRLGGRFTSLNAIFANVHRGLEFQDSIMIIYLTSSYEVLTM